MCLDRTLFFEDLNVLGHRVQTLLACQVEHNYSSLAIPKIVPRQGKELLLSLSIPNLEPHSLVIDLQCQTLEV